MIRKSGTIEHDELWDGEIQVCGDVLIPGNVSVRVAPGSRIRFDRANVCDRDEKRAALETLKMPVPGGIDPARCYIVVYGAWEVLGDAARRVVIGNEDWGGGILLFSRGGSGIRHALITHASIGVGVMGGAAAVVQTEVAHSVVGIFFPSGTVPSTLGHNTLHDNACGIVSYCLDPARGADVRIRGNLIAGNRIYGIFCSGVRPVIRDNTITKNDTGISQNDCEASRIENNELSGNRIGIHSSGIGAAEITGNRIADSANTGIFMRRDVITALIAGNTLSRAGKAIACGDVREGTVRDTLIEHAGVGIEVCGTSGVRVAGCTVRAGKAGIVYGDHSAGNVEDTAIAGDGAKDAVGIRVGGAAEVRIAKNEITGVCRGIQGDGMARLIVEGNTICADAEGMSCTDHASGVIKDNTIAGAGKITANV